MSVTDRYTSFCGLDCEQRATELMNYAIDLIERQQPANPLWRRIIERRQQPSAPDDLFLIHNYVFYLRDLFEQADDTSGTQLLEQLETDCC